MEKIKVLQVIGTLHIGGAENVAMNIIRYINNKMFEIHYLVYTSDIGEYEDEVIALGGKVIHLDTNTKNRKKYSMDLRNVINDNGPYDVIHSHMMFHNSIVLKIAKKCGIKVRVSHAHSTKNKITTNMGGQAIQLLYQKYTRFQILKYATLFLACGEKAGQFLYGEKKHADLAKVINNGIDIKKFQFNKDIRECVRKENKWENYTVYALAAHFQIVKNHKFLIDVFNEICKVDKKSLLVLMGEGDLKGEIKNQVIEFNLSDKVIFTGNVTNINEILQGIDIFIMPSFYEGIPVALIEAQAAGVKCIASDRISKEVDCTGMVEFISLDEGVERWKEMALCNKKYDRCDKSIYIKQAGYDVESNIKHIEKMYLQLVESRK